MITCLLRNQIDLVNVVRFENSARQIKAQPQSRVWRKNKERHLKHACDMIAFKLNNTSDIWARFLCK